VTHMRDPIPPVALSQRKIIVVIDDNPPLREVVSRSLRSAGYRVLDFGDPRVAIDSLAKTEETVALALIDGVMPDMLGPTVATEIQRLRPGIPVMLMSGHEAPMFSEFFDRPDRHFIAKPFVMGDLVSRIASVIGKPAATE
jgi:two-component system cell cycle sensor histidine kinase/response regulator CckA